MTEKYIIYYSNFSYNIFHENEILATQANDINGILTNRPSCCSKILLSHLKMTMSCEKDGWEISFILPIVIQKYSAYII